MATTTNATAKVERTLVVRFRGAEEASVYDRLQDFARQTSRDTGVTVHMTDLVRTWIGEKVGVA